MNNKLEEIAEAIRELRDSDFHVCPNDQDKRGEAPCTCGEFDAVIDKVEALISNL